MGVPECYSWLVMSSKCRCFSRIETEDILCSSCCVVWGLACADSPSSASESSVCVPAPRAIAVFTRHTNLSSLFYRGGHKLCLRMELLMGGRR